MDAGAEPPGTKPQEQVLNSEAARRVKYRMYFIWVHGVTKNELPNTAHPEIQNYGFFSNQSS